MAKSTDSGTSCLGLSPSPATYSWCDFGHVALCLSKRVVPTPGVVMKIKRLTVKHLELCLAHKRQWIHTC